jgi:REP element-mobilizing transposase RayT
VINRGNYRRDLFIADGAAESFEQTLFEACERNGWRLHGFVIMRNHFHLAVETPEPNLSEGMRWLQATWAARFNRFRGEVGRPFQGRYKALHVEPGHALAQVAHYIHLNPVRAGVLPSRRVGQFRWSSLHWYLQRKRARCLEPRTILAESGGLPDSKAGWQRYLGYLELIDEEDAKRREERFGRLSRGWVIGSKVFKAGIRAELKELGQSRFELLGADRQAHAELRAEIWEEKLQQLAKVARIRLEALPAKKAAPEKLRLAAAMKATTTASNRWLAERLVMGEPGTVSQYVRRFRLSGGTAEKQFRSLLSYVSP